MSFLEPQVRKQTVKIIHEADRPRLFEAALCTLLTSESRKQHKSLNCNFPPPQKSCNLVTFCHKSIPPQYIHTLSIFFGCFSFNSVHICMTCFKRDFQTLIFFFHDWSLLVNVTSSLILYYSHFLHCLFLDLILCYVTKRQCNATKQLFVSI